ncbi:TPA: hypothetical protein DIS56_01005 [Candidatus Saccharibacteria bacterium]|nr:MAG: hypothetical protein A3F05_04060 [Candidatus Saccharibacteria bacterium RIFCSPHIGHO2_12_FULL_47_17]HCM51699.1 hypothetical protein [Candidatus Saccharibacteria bacterium]
MQPSELKIYNFWVNIRNLVFKPLNLLLTKLGVSADMVSYLGVLVMIIFMFIVESHPITAFWLLFARMLIDILDGPLARYQKTDSDRGKFVDVLMDNLGFALFIFGVIKAGVLDGSIGASYLFLTELMIVLMIIRYNFKYRSEWFFRASAGSFPYNLVYASYVLFAIYAFGGGNYLNGAAQIFSAALVLRIITDYWIIQKAKPSLKR